MTSPSGRRAKEDAQVVRNASLPERRPYVLLAPIGSQMMQRKKSRVIRPAETRNKMPSRRAVKIVYDHSGDIQQKMKGKAVDAMGRTGKICHRRCKHKETLGRCPNEYAPFYIVRCDAPRKVHIECGAERENPDYKPLGGT